MNTRERVKKGLPVLCVIHNRKNSNLRKNTAYDETENLSLPGEIAKSYIDIGIIKINEMEYDEAIIVLTSAINTDKTQALAYYLRGLAKKEIEDYKGSLKDYDMAIELDETESDCYYNRAKLKSIIGDDLGSIKDYLLTIIHRQ